MRPRNAAILACRILAIFFASTALITIVGFLAATHGHVGVGEFWAYSLTQVFVAVVLWALAEGLANSMIRGASDEAPGSARPLWELLSAAFSIVGIIFIAQSIPALIGIAASSSGGLSSGAFEVASFGDRGAAVASIIVKLAVGGALIYGSRDIAEAVARRAGREPPPPPGL